MDEISRKEAKVLGAVAIVMTMVLVGLVAGVLLQTGLPTQPLNGYRRH